MQMPTLLASTVLILLFNLKCSLGVSPSTSSALDIWNYLNTLFPEGEQIQIDCEQPPCDDEDFGLTKTMAFKTCYRCDCPTQYVQICSTILRSCKCVAAQKLNNLRMNAIRKYDPEIFVFENNVPIKTGFLKWKNATEKNSENKNKWKHVADTSDDDNSLMQEENSMKNNKPIETGFFKWRYRKEKKIKNKNKWKPVADKSDDSNSLMQEENSMKHHIPIKTGSSRWRKRTQKKYKNKWKLVADKSDDDITLIQEKNSMKNVNKSSYTTSESDDYYSFTQEEESTNKPPVRKRKSSKKSKPVSQEPDNNDSKAKEEDTAENTTKKKKKLYSFDYLGANYWEVANLGLVPKKFNTKNTDYYIDNEKVYVI